MKLENDSSEIGSADNKQIDQKVKDSSKVGQGPEENSEDEVVKEPVTT